MIAIPFPIDFVYIAHGCDYSPFFSIFQVGVNSNRIKKKADSPCALLYTVERKKLQQEQNRKKSMEEKIMHLLITEDDTALAQGLQRALQEKNRQVLCCKNIQETRQHLHQNQTDLLILDVNLPDGSGFDLLQEIRRTSDLPVILLTANDLEMDIVNGLEQGANDYITKPFSLAVLRARVNTQLRNRTAQMQKESAKNTQIWEGNIWQFDFTNMRFTVSGQEVELSKTEQKLLALLVQHAGMTVPRETLMDRIWTDGAVYVDENALSVAIKRLRDKLQAKEQIRTVYGIGYVWEV